VAIVATEGIDAPGETGQHVPIEILGDAVIEDE